MPVSRPPAGNPAFYPAYNPTGRTSGGSVDPIDPSSLFDSSGLKGSVWSWHDINQVKQDTSGLVAVTSVSDPIRRVNGRRDVGTPINKIFEAGVPALWTGDGAESDNIGDNLSAKYEYNAGSWTSISTGFGLYVVMSPDDLSLIGSQVIVNAADSESSGNQFTPVSLFKVSSSTDINAGFRKGGSSTATSDTNQHVVVVTGADDTTPPSLYVDGVNLGTLEVGGGAATWRWLKTHFYSNNTGGTFTKYKEEMFITRELTEGEALGISAWGALL